MNIPSNLKYNKSHEWVSIDGNVATIGITDFAQSELGDIVYVELPEKGRELQLDEAFGTVESVKTVSELYAPLAGKVVAINEALQSASETVNSDPYGEGWMIRIEFAEQPSGLLDADAYKAFAES